MAEYKPQLPYSTPLYLLIPEYQEVKGVPVKKYPEPNHEMMIYASFKTYGGTETNVNDVYSVIDTANIETWYRPDIKSDCRIVRAEDGATYDILGEPENINMRNKYMKFKVRRTKGGA
jgi:hypothetical protein